MSAGSILVTGAAGQLGTAFCELLQSADLPFLATDVRQRSGPIRICDLTSPGEVEDLFSSGPISAIVHLAGLLPGASSADPVLGARVNVGGSVNLLRLATESGVKRFVFGSSSSVYGSAPRHVDEDSQVMPDDPYGAAKHLVEIVGEKLARAGRIQFASLRIARVVGPGSIGNTSSPWRMQLLDPGINHLSLPFGPSAKIALVHAAQVAKMLLLLVTERELQRTVYNTPAEIWPVERLKETLERTSRKLIRLQEEGEGGAVADGSRFSSDFRFTLKGIESYWDDLSPVTGRTRSMQ